MISTFECKQHQLAEQHAALFAAGNDLDGLFHVVAGEEQATERAADQRFNVAAVVTAFPDIAGDPVGQIRVGLEQRRVIL
jgi:hypothetical protein